MLAEGDDDGLTELELEEDGLIDAEGEIEAEGEREALGEIDGLSEDEGERESEDDDEGETDEEGESEADGEMEGETDADGEIDGEIDEDGLRLSLELLDGLRLALGEIDGEILELGESEALALDDGEREADGETEALGEREADGLITEGARDNIKLFQSPLVPEKLRALLPANLGPLLSPITTTPEADLSVVLAPAITEPAWSRSYATSQQLFAMVVKEGACVVCPVAVVTAEASGWPVCNTPVYETDIPCMNVDEDALITILFAPVAGLVSKNI